MGPDSEQKWIMAETLRSVACQSGELFPGVAMILHSMAAGLTGPGIDPIRRAAADLSIKIYEDAIDAGAMDPPADVGH